MVCQIAMEISIYEGFWDQNCERQMFVGGYTYQLHSEVDFGVVFWIALDMFFAVSLHKWAIFLRFH